MATTEATLDKRRHDRRLRHPLLADWRVAFRGRRRQVRRASDEGFVQPDYIKPEIVLVIVTILFMSALDAYFTLQMVHAGVVTEANPLMRWFMEHDIQLFVNIKTVLTASALVILAACSSLSVFQRHRVESILYGVLALYGVLISYHLAIAVRAGIV